MVRAPQQSGVITTLAAGVAALLSACAAGPDFKPPAPPATQGYVAEALPSATASTAVHGGETQQFQPGHDLPGQWWTLFGSAQLDALMEQAIHNYPDIAAQQAALRAARNNVRAGEGVFFPQLGAAANYTRAKSSGAAIGPGFPGFISNIYQANVNVSYAFDVFGGERRALEGLKAQAALQDYQLEASVLTLTSNIAVAVIQLASVTDQIAATQEIIELERKQLDLITRQFDLGSQTRADVLQQQANLAQVRATLPALAQQRAVSLHQLAVLTGRFPHDMAPIHVGLADLTLPRELPISLPSALVAQRPDIRMQEMTLHQASAAVGVATANMLPQLTLTASSGTQSLSAADLFKPAAAVWSLGAGLTQPIFAGGSLRARRRAAIDNYDAARSRYQLVVLQAFQNVADTLTALDHDAQALHDQDDAMHAAEASLAQVQKQYEAGAVNTASLLTAQQAYQQARIAAVRALASRYTDTVTLFQALGGGWWNRRDAGTVSPGADSPR